MALALTDWDATCAKAKKKLKEDSCLLAEIDGKKPKNIHGIEQSSGDLLSCSAGGIDLVTAATAVTCELSRQASCKTLAGSCSEFI